MNVDTGISVIVIGGEIGWDIKEDDFNVDAFVTDIESYPKPREMKAEIKIFLPARNEVREYVLHGVQGHIQISKPSFDDCAVIQAYELAQLLIANHIDKGTFKRIIESALHDIWFEGSENTDFAKILDHLNKSLGEDG